MISFENFLMADGVPIYLQILTYIKRGIIAGIIRDGDELPSRRVLSSLLGVNPNTVQKAYHFLEEEGLVESRAGAKSYMSLNGEKCAAVRSELLAGDIRSIVSALRQMGLTCEEAAALLAAYWDEEGQE